MRNAYTIKWHNDIAECVPATPRKRLYVGVKNDYTRETFWSPETPTGESHGHLYAYVIGPFRTKAGAVFMRDYGANNPHCQCVYQAERIARRLKSQSEVIGLMS